MLLFLLLVSRPDAALAQNFSECLIEAEESTVRGPLNCALQALDQCRPLDGSKRYLKCVDKVTLRLQIRNSELLNPMRSGQSVVRTLATQIFETQEQKQLTCQRSGNEKFRHECLMSVELDLHIALTSLHLYLPEELLVQ